MTDKRKDVADFLLNNESILLGMGEDFHRTEAARFVANLCLFDVDDIMSATDESQKNKLLRIMKLFEPSVLNDLFETSVEKYNDIKVNLSANLEPDMSVHGGALKAILGRFEKMIQY